MILTLENVARRFGGLVALSDVSFSVPEAQILGIIGKNGAGKTTLFNLIAGRFAPSSGTIRFSGEDIGGRSASARAMAGIARTFQIPEPLPRLSVFENVLAGAFARIRDRSEAGRLAHETLNFCDLSAKADVASTELTVPELKRLEVARALATQPRLLLLDEVMAGLRPNEVDEAMVLCRRIRDRGVTILFVEHVMRAVMNLCDRVVVLDQGRIIADGAPAAIRGDEAVIDAYLGREADA
ncbi:MAG: ABC transporter ATP-binding protein [Rhizobiaceae bacterium]|nr:ABC transporter ATP-binding protein [Rhizobiaceae bacterium]